MSERMLTATRELLTFESPADRGLGDSGPAQGDGQSDGSHRGSLQSSTPLDMLSVTTSTVRASVGLTHWGHAGETGLDNILCQVAKPVPGRSTQYGHWPTTVQGCGL